MKKTNILILFAILQVFSFRLLANDNVNSINHRLAYDPLGRIIVDENGNKINYNTPDLQQKDFPKQATIPENKLAQTQGSNVLANCNSAWNYTIMGTILGKRSMQTIDLDKDEKSETVLGAMFTGGSAWYVLTYDSSSNQYIKSFVSDFFESRTITCMQYFDINNDSILEIFVGFDNGQIFVYDGLTKALTSKLTISTSSDDIRAIEFGDIDNNGTNEMVISSDYNMFFYNATSLTLINQITGGTYDLKIGNVDADPINEIVTSNGDVLQYNGTTAPVQWHYYTSNYTNELVELSDIDLDGKLEIIKANAWYTIKVFDADVQLLKFTITADLDINSLAVVDINNDNIAEIIYGDGQWGEIHCMNATTHGQMWQIANPGHGVSEISIGDTDFDGDKDIIWGNGASSSAGDTLNIYDLNTRTRNWKSKAIDGPYYAVDVDDIDNDGNLEIVAISYESSSGYDSGVLSVFDATTHVLEWESDGAFFYDVWTGIFDFEIKDIDNNGDKEIIVAAGDAYTGKIWIVDGTTKTIQSSHLFQTENLDEFYSVAVDDVDNDGNLEIVAIGNEVNIINPLTYAIEWSSAPFGGSDARIVKIENVDADSAKEIIICRGAGFNTPIYVIDGITHTMTQTTNTNYKSFDLYDVNHDGKKDIVAGNANGTVDVINGSNLQVISTSNILNTPIDGILVSSINSDTIPEYVIGSKGKIYFQSSQGTVSNVANQFGLLAGFQNALKVLDVNNDGKKEVFFGTTMAIQELSTQCTQCISFAAAVSKQNVLCAAPNSGFIHVSTSGGQFPISYSWNSGSTDSTLANLNTGNYFLSATDAAGCNLKDTLIIVQSALIGSVLTQNVNCNASVLGSASVNINLGTPPYTFNWSNGSTNPNAAGLSSGNYSVLVHDSANCTATLPFSINRDTVVVMVHKNNVTCAGQNNGGITIYVTNGTPPFTINWENNYFGWNLYGLSPGKYIYHVSNAGGCMVTDTVKIEPAASSLILQVSTIPDNPNTPIADGGANVSASGGQPPYTIQWSDPFLQTTPTVTNLAPGHYTVIVRDINGCTAQASVDIWVIGIRELNKIKKFSLLPNPSKGSIRIDYDLGTNNEMLFTICDLTGRTVFEQQFTNNQQQVSIDLANLADGFYTYNLIMDSKIVGTDKLILAK